MGGTGLEYCREATGLPDLHRPPLLAADVAPPRLACNLQDPRTGLLPRIFILLALAYALSPIDLIPDFIPVRAGIDKRAAMVHCMLVAGWLVPAPVEPRIMHRCPLLEEFWLIDDPLSPLSVFMQVLGLVDDLLILPGESPPSLRGPSRLRLAAQQRRTLLPWQRSHAPHP